MPKENGEDLHAHVISGIDITEIMQQAVRASRARDVVSEAAEEAKRAITVVMVEEYVGLSERAREFDHLLTDSSVEPNLQQGASAYARHTLAADAGEALAKMLAPEDHDIAQEYRAQAHEHRAQVERWIVNLRNVVRLRERIFEAAAAADAEKKTEEPAKA